MKTAKPSFEVIHIIPIAYSTHCITDYIIESSC